MRVVLHKHILNELWPTFLASLFVAVFIILATKMLSITEMIVNQGVGAAQVGVMIVYLLPDIIAFALPAAALIAVVVGFLRLSADNEIIALKSCGISLYQMLPPVLALSFLGFVAAIAVSVIAVPWGNRSFKNLLFEIAASKADLGIKERVFCEPFDNVIFYVNSYSPGDRVMREVFVVDKRNPRVTNTIVAAQAGALAHPRKKAITLRFSEGSVFVTERGKKTERTIKFSTYDLNINLKDIMAALQSRRKDPKEMSVGELFRKISSVQSKSKDYYEMMIELMEKFALPVGVFFMGLIGAPLGAQLKARGRSAGIGVSLLVFLIYYFFLAAARSFCETGAVPPVLGVWIPNLFLASGCVYLLRRVARERPIELLPQKLRRMQKH